MSLLSQSDTESSNDDALRRFNADFEAKLASKLQNQQEVGSKAATQAQEDLANFLSQRNAVRDAKQASNRMEEQATMERLVAEDQENPWERVVSLVDVKQSSPELDNKARMRQLFIQLKGSK